MEHDRGGEVADRDEALGALQVVLVEGVELRTLADEVPGGEFGLELQVA